MTAKPLDVGVLNPLQVPVAKEVLQAIVEDCITAILENRGMESPDDAFETELLLEQRRQFLRWLATQPGVNVNMAMYPLEPLLSFEGQVLH